MSKPNKFLLVSLPNSISPSGHKDAALEALRASVSSDAGTTFEFNIPAFKIGTLDALVQQADDLAKLEAGCEAVVAKVADSLRTLLDGDEEKIQQQKTINDKPVDQYLRNFSWNKVKYRVDKPIAELIDSLQKEVTGIDNDVKSKFNQYNSIKTNLAAAQRKQTGNLSTRSLVSIVPPSVLVQDSEYLETHLIAVPGQLVKEFLKSYETIAPMVVPRSASQVAKDDEFTLFGVTTFKKHSSEFVHKCREKRWTPREYKYKEGGKEEEQQETERLSKEERKLWVLRYGLPLDFVCGLVQTTEKLAKKVKTSLDNNYSYLAGNALTRDKKGRVTQDDAAMSEIQAAGHLGDGEYTAFVYYEFEIV